MYDVIIVGARVAGSATALLLARRGVRVLVVDRAAFPSDTLSTHQVQLPGVARLARWGLLDRLVAAGTPPTRRLLFDPGPVALEGPIEGAIYSPRRTVLDKILVDAAREAGAEVRENVVVEGLLTDRTGRVTGIRCQEKRGITTTEQARLVIGADGKHRAGHQRRAARRGAAGRRDHRRVHRRDGALPALPGGTGPGGAADVRLHPAAGRVRAAAGGG